MARKSKRKTKPFENKINKAVLAGSSNNLQTDQLAKFPLDNISNKARRGGNAVVGYPNNYCLQLLPLRPRTVYIVLLSFNHILKSERQIGKLDNQFCKRVRQCLNILRSHGLNLQTKLIVCMPPLRLHPRTWDTQRREIHKLESILDKKGITHFNPMHDIPHNIPTKDYYNSKDLVHLKPEIEKHFSQKTADALREFLQR